MNKEIIETIRYHIDNNMLITIERKLISKSNNLEGFPIIVTDDYLLMTIVSDFHDEGYSIIKVSDISDAYSKENVRFYEKICINEGLGVLVDSPIIKSLENIYIIFEQLTNYKGFLTIQCETRIRDCDFFIGKIVSIGSNSIILHCFSVDGIWDTQKEEIMFDDITQITFGDNYSKMFYKYSDEIFLKS